MFRVLSKEDGTKRINRIKYRKTLNGNIIKVLDEQYVSKMPCGVSTCMQCETNISTNLQFDMSSSEDQSKKRSKVIYILDDSFISNQIDLISQFDALTNCVVLKSTHENLVSVRSIGGGMSSGLLKWNMIQEIIESNSNITTPNFSKAKPIDIVMEDINTEVPAAEDLDETRNFYYFYNENHESTYFTEQEIDLYLNGRSKDMKNKIKCFKVLLFYISHWQFALNDDRQIVLLTDTLQDKNEYKEIEELGQSLIGKEAYDNISQFINIMTTDEYIASQSEGHADELSDFAKHDMSSSFISDLCPSKELFPPHIDSNTLLLSIKQGKYLMGRLQVSRFSLSEAIVHVSGISNDILIPSSNTNLQINMNRGLNMDMVAIELLPETEWIAKGIRSEAVVTDILEKAAEEHEDEGEKDEELMTIVEKINSSDKQPTAKVVGVVQGGANPTNGMTKSYAGSTVTFEDLNDKDKSLLESFNTEVFRKWYRIFVPHDVRMEKIIIKSNRPEYLDGKRIIVKVDGWETTLPFPYGHVVKVIGDNNDAKTESDVILHEFNIDSRPFSKKVLNCLPQEGDKWEISPEEERKRLDLRGLNVCSIDPPGCKDIDDALHCTLLPNGNYQVGVHIADVTHFVKPGAEIDKEAARRCTTVYLVERRTDMLPGLLTENLCSLVSKVDRLSFSVIWEINSKTFEIESVDFHKSIIRSVASLSYKQAQSMIDDKSDNSELTKSIRYLMKIAVKLRQKRNDVGALTLASPEVRFNLEKDTLNPTDVALYQHVDTNFLVEEFMLLANVAVATKIAETYPSYSVLRRHESPKTKELDEFKRLLLKSGFTINSESSKSLAESLDKADKDNDKVFNKVIRILVTRCMNQALYFNTADFEQADFHHYGLAAPMYTHFTSPIRRYADVLVHRLLAASLDLYSLPNLMTDKDKVSKQCNTMNKKNRLAALASRASADFYTYKFFKDKKNVIEEAIIIKISTAGVHIMILKYGIEGVLQQIQGEIEIETDPENERAVVNKEIEIKTFQHIKVEIISQLVDYRRSIAIKFVEVEEVME